MNILYIYDKNFLPFFNDYPLVCHPFLFDILNSYFLVDKKIKQNNRVPTSARLYYRAIPESLERVLADWTAEQLLHLNPIFINSYRFCAQNNNMPFLKITNILSMLKFCFIHKNAEVGIVK